MFSSKLARVANRTCAAATGASSSSTCTAHRATQCLTVRRQTHQRRHSSSKASSCPPDSNASGGKPAATAKGTAADGSNPIAEPASQQRSGKKVSRPKRSRHNTDEHKVPDHFAGLPAVPGTQHIDEQDLRTSAFFSLYRPLSLGSTIPPPATETAFESVFRTKQQRDPWENGNSAERRPEDIVYALGPLFENLDASASEAQDDGVRWEVLSESPSHQEGSRHLDGPPRLRSLDDLVSQLRPFTVPPPPQPFTEDLKQSEQKKRASKPKQKRYKTTIYLTESTTTNGQVEYSASVSPIERVPEEQSAVEEAVPEGRKQSTFRERMQRYRTSKAYLLRQQSMLGSPPTKAPIRRAPSAARKERMLLISVKRQRKLKMKKHKYKKLMKRTRNLRRRQDRA
ncbi:hypothetical protein AC578_5456 [Pseudocercospora eumusae]|uniref:Small ribosomal subunit protein mS38 n=1 Tax=Pseudocercospora eumusae TaxID=321146 RepID=A0A139HK06_9PEZI|nr:hypothetical protein AC578_5456 [Pseudocercospora eumusae]